jgi:hypothetical protein
LFHPYLSAFRKRHGCQTLLIKFVDDLKISLDRKEYCGAVLADLSKAFDCIPHQLVIAKLKAYGLSKEACMMMASYLGNRSQRVKLGTARSTWEPLKKGVPQGSILGPLIFNIFLNDMFDFMSKACIYNYADDTTIVYTDSVLSKVKEVLNQEVGVLVQWFNSNGMKANPDKFQTILFKPTNHPKDQAADFSISLGDTVISESNIVKLLGVFIDNDLSFNEHVDRICKKSGKQLNALKRISRYLSATDKNLIYESFIMSNLNYCAPVWTFSSKASEEKLECIQKRALRYIFKDYEHDYHDMLRIYDFPSIKLKRLRILVCEVFKCVKKLCPEYLWSVFEENRVSRRDNMLVLSQWNTVRNGFLSFHYYGARLYNQLPPEMRAMEAIEPFKNALKNWKGPTCKCDKCSIYFHVRG